MRRRRGWEQSLASLLASGQAGSARRACTPLAIELTLAARSARVAGAVARGRDAAGRLMARPVRPGKNGGWIAGGLSWGQLDT